MLTVLEITAWNWSRCIRIGSSAYAGRSATEMQVSFDAIPMADGLKIGASYFERDEQGAASKRDADAQSGAYYATYAVGNIFRLL